MLSDTRNRPLRELRLSLTDACNFRCYYCMPHDVTHTFDPPSERLTCKEIVCLVEQFARLGVVKVRLTGGEPLLRADLMDIIAEIRSVPGIREIALTTNGSTLEDHAEALKAAGLDRVTVSVDSLDPDAFQRITHAPVDLARVLRGVDAARAAGLNPVKINAVIRRGVNEDAILPLAAYFKERGCVLRFIEYMDTGTCNQWSAEDVVPAAEIVEQLHERWGLAPVLDVPYGQVASRYDFLDGSGEVGVIASVTHPFCGTCNRGRVSARGEFYTCLFATNGTDLRTMLRAGDTEGLFRRIDTVWAGRDDQYSVVRSEESTRDRAGRVEMYSIGG